MNTNLPLVLRTSDGPTWSNGWVGSGAYLDMIGKQYKEDHEQEKKGARTVKERVKNGIGTGSRTGFKSGQKWVLNVKKTESRQIREFGKGKNGPAASFHIFPAIFLPFCLFFHLFLMILAKNGKKRVPKMKERERKERVSFPFPFFTFPFLAYL